MNNHLDVHATLDKLFRRQAGQLTATLARVLGPSRLDLAESVVQDALLAAMQTWPLQGIPDNPAGWLMRVARNKATDVLRKERFDAGKEDDVAYHIEQAAPANPVDGALALAKELSDDQLRLLFICCHPVVAADAHVPLALKALFGFGTAEIARAFLTKEETLAQRLVRAKRKIADSGLKFELPPAAELASRLPSVLDTLYLVFSEGYNTHGGDVLVRKDICLEAIRIATLLAESPGYDSPQLAALLAMMCFHASRLDARTDDTGDILLLKDQDRANWDHRLVARGVGWLKLAARGETLSRFHFEAGVAACHSLAPSYEATDWAAIVSYYEGLEILTPSPIVALNLAVAISMRDGPAAGLAALGPLKKDGRLQSYYLLPGVEGEFLLLLGRKEAARTAFRRALDLAGNAPERRFLEKKLAIMGTIS